MNPTHERRPTEEAATRVERPAPSLPTNLDHRSLSWHLADLSPDMQARVTRAFVDGMAEGINRGRRALEAEYEASWADMRQTIRAAASAPDYATLADRRGQHARAAATRRLWASRGLSEGVAS